MDHIIWFISYAPYDIVYMIWFIWYDKKARWYPLINSIAFWQTMWKSMIVCYIINDIFVDTTDSLCKIASGVSLSMFILLMFMKQTIFTIAIFFDFILSCLSLTYILVHDEFGHFWIMGCLSHDMLHIICSMCFMIVIGDRLNLYSGKLLVKMVCKLNKGSPIVLYVTLLFENGVHYQHWTLVHGFRGWNDICLRKILIPHGFGRTSPKLYLLRLLPFESE